MDDNTEVVKQMFRDGFVSEKNVFLALLPFPKETVNDPSI